VTTNIVRHSLKSSLGPFPRLARLYQRTLAKGHVPQGGYSVERLKSAVPGWAAAAESLRHQTTLHDSKRVFLVGYLRWWLDHVSSLGLLLAGMGHSVHMGYLPYGRWSEPILPFDAHRQSSLIRDALKPAESLIHLINLTRSDGRDLAPDLMDHVHAQSIFDLQYTLQKEHISIDAHPGDRSLYRIRFERNLAVARAILNLLERSEFDVMVIPNGSILEFGMIFRLARWFDLPVITYDFGEQRARIWLAQNAEIMRQDTSSLWAVRGEDPFTDREDVALEELYSARREGKAWANFARRWQSGQRQGVQELRSSLGFDPDKPMVLLCTNVVGDSLALGRQIFTKGMADWLEMTIRHFAKRQDVQLVVRVHPGELLGAGYPSTEIVRQALPNLPEHIVVVPPESPVNTYDLIAQASMGLVYTTTVGLEMAMSGLPVIVSGMTHYRGKGFTYDPDSKDEYLAMLASSAVEPLNSIQVQKAKHYAYVFFFEYPFPYPWHLIGFWDDIKEIPLEKVATKEGLIPYQRTIQVLLGQEPVWGEAG
jgi:hypothetical protein